MDKDLFQSEDYLKLVAEIKTEYPDIADDNQELTKDRVATFSNNFQDAFDQNAEAGTHFVRNCGNGAGNSTATYHPMDIPATNQGMFNNVMTCVQSSFDDQHLDINSSNTNTKTFTKVIETETPGQNKAAQSIEQSPKNQQSTKKEHKCDMCGKFFARNYNLLMHMKIHTGDKSYTCSCPTCGKPFTRRVDLRKHERIHSGEKRFICKTCGKRFTESSHLIIHEKIHTGEKPHACAICGKRFVQSCNLRRHELVHTGEHKSNARKLISKDLFQGNNGKKRVDMINTELNSDYKLSDDGAPTCSNDVQGTLARNTEAGMYLVHNEGNTMPSTIFNTNDIMNYVQRTLEDQQHLDNINSNMNTISSGIPKLANKGNVSEPLGQNIAAQPNERPPKIEQSPKIHTCNTCGKSFTRKYNLEVHTKIHTGEKSYTCTCNTCGKPFGRRVDLRKHERIHTGERPFACKTCGNRFTESSHLISHMKTHTGEKAYQCATCGKRFVQSCNLRRHERLHTGTFQLYMCKTCGKCCANSSELRRHERVHTGEKPFECGVCGKRYSDKGSLQYHAKLHTGEEKSYICGICEKAFYTNYKLILHMRQHTGEKPYRCSLCGKGFTRKRHWIKHETTHKNEHVDPKLIVSAVLKLTGFKQNI